MGLHSLVEAWLRTAPPLRILIDCDALRVIPPPCRIYKAATADLAFIRDCNRGCIHGYPSRSASAGATTDDARWIAGCVQSQTPSSNRLR